jgi:NAD(P)-dependent dehydrogenase (short-subunit alcohol dehydrogenase family)
MTGRLDGKVAIVTGAGGGIGRAHALALAAEGAAVLVNDLGTRSGADAASVVAEIEAAGGRAAANSASATWDFAPGIVEQALDAFGRIDILINNATAGGRPANLWDVTEQEWDLAFDVNLKGYFAMIRAATPHFAGQRSGVIVNTSSGAGFGFPASTAYSAAKEGLIGLTRTVAREIGRFGIRCNAIRPLALGVSSAQHGAATAKWMKLIMLTTSPPGGRNMAYDVATPETHPPAKIAPMVVWLCTDAAKRVNGRTFHVRGDTVALLNEPAPDRIATRDGGWTLDALDVEAPAGLVEGLNNDFLLHEHPDLQVFETEQA